VAVIQDKGSGPGRSLVCYGLVTGGALTMFLGTFLLAGAFAIAVLDDPTPWLAGRDVASATVGITLLIVDAVLPVPSSLVMLANGALFGVIGGSALSLVGSIGAALVGYGLGRRAGAPLIRASRSETERTRADRLVRRWGVLAVAMTRPVPLLAETVAVAAGASSLGVARTAAWSSVGAAPGAVLYAAAGANGLRGSSSFVVFAAVLALATVPWMICRRIGSSVAGPGST
jgi:uncharacterized membrane protein YdjX (TVP38/TMEM64 family)